MCSDIFTGSRNQDVDIFVGKLFFLPQALSLQNLHFRKSNGQLLQSLQRVLRRRNFLHYSHCKTCAPAGSAIRVCSYILFHHRVVFPHFFLPLFQESSLSILTPSTSSFLEFQQHFSAISFILRFHFLPQTDMLQQ